MAQLLPRKLIDPPNTQAPARVGLITAANGPKELEPHMLAGGLEYVPVLCGGVHPYPQNCTTPPPTKTFDGIDGTAPGDESAGVVGGFPFLLYSSIQCGTYGYDFDELAARAVTRLEAHEQAGVESVFWGADASDPAGILQTLNPTPLTDATNIVTGLSRLEQALATCYGLPGLIHVTSAAMPYLSNHHVIEQDKDGKWRTANGNVVVSEFGASGLGPADEAIPAGGGWMYATGPVNIWRSDIFVPDPRQTFDREHNQHKILAERSYVITVDCCVHAIQVTTWEGAY